jgi:histidinol phosphatase-like PHP family hydrolase
MTAWQPRDCHAHTTLSDGALDPQAVVEAVRARGVLPSISDHVTRDIPARAIRSLRAVRAYLDTIERLDVARGGEFCWHDTLWQELPPSLAARFTHRLGSLHAIWLPSGTLVHAFVGLIPPEVTADEYMDAHLDNLERFAREMPVDILAHPTLLPGQLRERPLEELWTEEREERAVEALFAAGIAFELSNRYRVHERFAHRAVQRGVRISLGSDGHSLEQLGDVVWPLELARQLGVRDEDLYDPLAHGSRTLELARRPRA